MAAVGPVERWRSWRGERLLLLQSPRKDLDAGNTRHSSPRPKQPIHRHGDIVDSCQSNAKHNKHQSGRNLEVGGISPAQERFGKHNHRDHGQFGHLIHTNRVVLQISVAADNGETLGT